MNSIYLTLILCALAAAAWFGVAVMHLIVGVLF
jgi:hypothetical protein